MRTVTFTSDRQKDMLHIYSDLWGFYLCGTNDKRVIASVVPLAQHLFWKNEKLPMVPQAGSEFPHALLTKQTISIVFGEVRKMRPPKIPQKGWWYEHRETKKEIFVPSMQGRMADPTMFAKVMADIQKRHGGIQQ